MKRLNFPKSLFILLSLSASTAPAKDFIIGGLYAETSTGHFGCTCSREALCVSEGLVRDAQRRGQKVRFHNLAPSYAPMSIVTAAKTVTNLAYDAAVGATLSSDAIIAADIFEVAGIPFVTPTATNPRVTEGKKLSVRMAFSDRRQATLLARVAMSEAKHGSIAVIRNISQPYSDFLGTEFVAELGKAEPGIDVKDFKLLDGISNLPEVVSKALANRPAVIFAPLYRDDLSLIYEELLQRKSAVLLLSSDTIETEPKFAHAGVKSSGPRFYFTKHWDGELNGPTAKAYARFHQRHCRGLPVSMTSIAAYDALSLILETHRSRPSLRGKEFAQALRNHKYSGVLGPVRRDATGEPVKPLYLFELTPAGSRLVRALE